MNFVLVNESGYLSKKIHGKKLNEWLLKTVKRKSFLRRNDFRFSLSVSKLKENGQATVIMALLDFPLQWNGYRALTID